MMIFEVILMLVCLAGSFFFSGIETGVISINRLRLRHLVRRDVPGAKIIQDFLMEPDRLLGTTLVGNNICNVIATILAASWGVRWFGSEGSWITGIVLTLVILVACEYIPKAWFQSFPARRTLPFAKLLFYCSRVLAPIGKLLTNLIKLVVPEPPEEKQNGQPFVSRDELMHLTREGERSGVLTPDEHRMIHGVFELKAKPCGQIMIPRQKIISVPAQMPIADLLKLAREKEFNRFPVYDGERKTFIGLVHIFDVLADIQSTGKIVKDYMRPPQLVSIFTPVDHVLPRMRVTRQPMVLVSDERMEVVGLVTLEDVLEEVVGEF
jgi:putative hemolysin